MKGFAIRVVRVLALSLGGAYLIFVTALFCFQRWIIFPATPADPFLPTEGATRELVPVSGGSVPMDVSGEAGAPRVVFFHGNAEQIAQTRNDASEAEDAGLSFAAVEYPGYGDAEAIDKSETTILEAARAGIAALAAKGEGAPVCVGHSLGSGVATAMAAEGRCAKLVVISPYTSMVDMAADQYPWVPVRLLVLDRFDSFARAADVKVPALVIHGRRDDLIPFRMGEAMATALHARFVPRDRGHNDIRDRETWNAIGAFALE